MENLRKGSPDQALFHSTIDPCELWHQRFVHLHYRALPLVSKAVLGILELQEKHEGVCKGCAQGKNVKKPFPSSDNEAKGILDIIDSDVCGLMTATSLSGYVYSVSFIDDFSRKTWIYFLKGKNEVFGKFKEFKPLSHYFFLSSEQVLHLLRH